MPQRRRTREIQRTLAKRPMSDVYQDAADDLRLALPKKRTYWDRRHGLRAMARYMLEQMPEVFSEQPWGFTPPLTALEIGPGAGYWMEYMREAGHTVYGVDAPASNDRLQAMQEMTDEIGLRVEYIGAEALWGPLSEWADMFHVIHVRGALDLVIGRFSDAEQRQRVRDFMASCERMLQSGGVLHVAHNRGGIVELIYDEMRSHDGLRFEEIAEYVTRSWKE